MRLEIKMIFKWLFIILIVLGLILVGISVLYMKNSTSTDKEGTALADTFYNDLLNKNYENILSYTYIPDEVEITTDDIESYMEECDGLFLILEFPDKISVREFGDTEMRRINIAGYDIEENYYQCEFKVKKIDGELLLYFDELIKE